MWGGRPKPWMSPNLNFVCQIGLPSNEMFFDNVSASTLVEHENKHDGQGGGGILGSKVKFIQTHQFLLKPTKELLNF